MQPPTPAPAPPPKPARAPATVKPQRPFRRFVWIVLLIAFAFVLGYGPKEWERRRLAERLEQTELDLRLANLHRQLGMVNFEVQQNNFAGAATNAVLFFEGCRNVVDDAGLEDRPRTRLALQTYASTSDMVLGQLANGDPAVKQRLGSLYQTMNGLLERKQ